MILIRIEAPYFVAGAEFKSITGSLVCIREPPILKYMHGWNLRKVIEHSKNKNWVIRAYSDSDKVIL